MEQGKITSQVGILLAVLLAGFFLLQNGSAEKAGPGEDISFAQEGVSTAQDIKSEIDTTLDVLHRLHYISLTDTPLTSAETVILDSLTEAMSDLNKLRRILPQAEQLSHSQNETVATTGLVLRVSISQLIDAHEKWVTYLRNTDLNSIQISEFQYQLSLLETSSHDIYLTLVETASYFPFVAVEFAENEDNENTVNEELKSYFLDEIDSLFADVLEENEQYRKETGNQYAIPALIKGYKDFFTR